MFYRNDKVRIKYGVLYKGFDLSGLNGIVKDTQSYVEVYIPSINQTCKMLQHEIEPFETNPFDEITEEDIERLFDGVTI
jgi:hypothetical protein